jgi:hypothetical protein
MVLLNIITACNLKPENNAAVYASLEKPLLKRELTTIAFCDNASDTPAIASYELFFNIKDSTNGSFAYIDYQEQDTTKKDITLSPERIDVFKEYLSELSNVPDNWVVRPGKMICPEKYNALVLLIFNSGDTTNYIISAAARCDPRLFPTWHKVDSMRQVIFKEVQSSG